MDIGIIGAGSMGASLGKLWAEAGHNVLFSFSKDPAKLEAVAHAAGTRARTGTPVDAAQFGAVVFIGVPFDTLETAIAAAGSLVGKTIISCVSGLRPDFKGETMGLPTELTISVAERLAQLAPQAHIVEAFNTTFAEILASPSRQFNGERPSVFYCGDDAAAKSVAAELIEDCGFEAVDAGGLKSARVMETLATAWVQFAAATELFPQLGLKALRR